MPDPTLKNVFEAILKYGHDEDLRPRPTKNLRPPRRLPVPAKSLTCLPNASAAAIRYGMKTIGLTTAA